MLGTIINTCTILIGSTFGALVRTGIGEKYKQILFNALGLCIVLPLAKSPCASGVLSDKRSNLKYIK